MRYNYPVKYAVMPIYEQIGWIHGLNELEPEIDKTCYVVSKCFVVGEGLNYYEDGSINKKYEVVFPYQYRMNREWHREYPYFNNHGCTNSTYVPKLFDTFDNCKKVVDKMNDSTIKNNIVRQLNSLYFNGEKKDLETTYQNKLEKIGYLEKLIEEKTSNMKVNASPKEQHIIFNQNEVMLEKDMTLYQFLSIYDTMPFVVYSVTNREFEILKDGIKKERSTKDSLSMINFDRPMIVNYVNSPVIRLYDHKGNSNYSLKNGILVKEAEIKDISPFLPEGLVVYTTENYMDVIGSYDYEDIDLEEEFEKFKNSGKAMQKEI